MDNPPPTWQGGFPIQNNTLFASSQLDAPQNHEDWEEWLRWDPAADYGSPEDGTLHSGSSKNDSPIQDSVMPVDTELFGKGDTLAPPLIMGEDTFDFGTGNGDDAFLFGAQNDGTAEFDFQSLMPMEQQNAGMPKLDTNAETWGANGALDANSVNLSALTNETYQTLPSAGTVSSTAPSMHFSPEASQNGTSVTSNSPDPPKKRGGRKRKAEVEAEIKEQNGDSNGSGDEPPVKKTSHNVIEKRYRNNLNDKIVELRNSVPALRAVGRANGNNEDDEDLEGLTAAHKLNKATVMAKATEYIKHLEKRNKTMSDEMDALKARLAAVESAIGKSRDRQASMSNSPPNASGRQRQASSSSQNGFLNVPQQMVQQQYMQAQTQPTYTRQPNPPAEAQNQPQYVNGRGGGVMNKVMLGTMAGIMVMEGFSTERQDEGDTSSRGLFALPTHLVKRGLEYASSDSMESAALARQAFWPLLKMVLVIGALFYILAPLVSFRPRPKQKARPSAVRLPPAPSLASPIEVRRKAWLTALQTVWVPKHFLLEVVAVTTKMISLSLRRLVGSDAYNSLTGANKEEEVARIKAWDIAIDAQLAGGDAEVSYYRLLLTLMESGTLPDSPTRLMQKAVHFRVFFWELANAGYGNLLGFKSFTEKVGKIYWDSARRQQKELLHAKAQGRPSQEEDEVELLPNHLASLLELDCDEVLGDEMIQRAWNLAWNKPSAHFTRANAARDSVVEDHAIRSPLDAVAAWYTNLIVDDTLAESLTPGASTMDLEYYITLAVSIAPPASSTLARALAAKAVLSNTNRDTNVLAALDALPAPSSSADMNLVKHVPAAPDVRTALTLAKLLALSAPQSPPSAQHRALATLSALHLPPASFTLLTAAAAHKLLKLLTSEHRQIRSLQEGPKHGVEDLAANLRVWVGTGRKGAGAGEGVLGEEEVEAVVGVCLGVARRMGGWGERDSGYGSGSGEGSPVVAKAEVGVR